MLTAIRALFVVLIIGLFYCIAYQTIIAPTQETTEGRNLSVYPAAPTNYAAIQPFFNRIDAWAADRMHYRQQFITSLNRARIKLGFSNFGKVVIGKDDWLFLAEPAADGAREHEDARGTTQFSPEELRRWKSYLLYRKADVEARGGKFIFFVAPNKSTIYPEYLPDNFQILSSNSRLQQLTDVMHGTGVDLIDVRPVLLEAKKHAPLYNKYETHWNMQAANYVQHLVMQTLSKHFPDITPALLPFHYCTPTEAGLISGRDLYRMLGFHDAITEPGCVVVENVGACVDAVTPDALRQWPLSVGDCAAAGNQQNDPAWLGLIGLKWGHLADQHRNFLFKSSFNAPKKYSVFVQHDSFFEMLQPFFSNQFQSVHYSFLSRPMEKEIWAWFLDALRPDIVIEEIVERALKKAVPRAGMDYPQEYETAL